MMVGWAMPGQLRGPTGLRVLERGERERGACRMLHAGVAVAGTQCQRAATTVGQILVGRCHRSPAGARLRQGSTGGSCRSLTAHRPRLAGWYSNTVVLCAAGPDGRVVGVWLHVDLDHRPGNHRADQSAIHENEHPVGRGRLPAHTKNKAGRRGAQEGSADGQRSACLPWGPAPSICAALVARSPALLPAPCPQLAHPCLPLVRAKQPAAAATACLCCNPRTSP